MDVPVYQPSTDRRPPMSRNGEVSSDSAAPRTISRPRGASPPTVALIAGPCVTVARTTLAPPIFANSAAGGAGGLSAQGAAPRGRGGGSLSLPPARAAVRSPIGAAYGTPGWRSPPRPRTATRSPGRAPLLRSALNVVTPAHISGAASGAGRCAGTRARAVAGVTR